MLVNIDVAPYYILLLLLPKRQRYVVHNCVETIFECYYVNVKNNII